MSDLIRKVRTVVTRIQQEDDDDCDGGRQWPHPETMLVRGQVLGQTYVQSWLSEISHVNNSDNGERMNK
jgi:hypothetical protein